MYNPPLRSHYESILSSILGTQEKFKSSKLLQAYVTFSAVAENEGTLLDSYTSVCKQYTDYRNALLRITNRQCENLRPEDISMFIDLSFEDFLIYVTPDVVCDPAALMAYFHKSCIEYDLDQVKLLHHIISVKLNTFEQIEPKLLSGLSDENDPLSLLYQQYAAKEKQPLPANAFYKLYSLINVYRLDASELEPKYLGSSRKKLSDLISILFNDLQLTRAQALKMVEDFFCNNHQAAKINKDQEIYNFIQKKDDASRIKLLHKALKLMAKFSPLELMCTISLRKKDGTSNERNKTEAYIVPNDIPLENSLVYSQFFSRIPPKSDAHILILLPSPQFVSKVLWTSRSETQKITFVFDNESVSNSLSYQAGELCYAPAIGNDIRFTYYPQWIDKSDHPSNGYSHVLLFGMRQNILERSDLISVLTDHCAENTSMLILDPSQYIEEKCFSNFNSNKIHIEKIALIPQGINNSTHPRRKALICCKVSPACSSASLPANIELHTYTLNTVLKTQALSPMQEKPVLISCNDLLKNTQTLRQLYSKEITLRRPAGRERIPSFSHEVTPDIVVWCSKTYPKDNHSRPRLEAYVCEPAPESRINSGFAERGPRISSTIKHTTSTLENGILDWLEHVYPYSVIIPKRTRTSDKSALTVTRIQDEIIAHYTEYLEGKNIALKTLWYLYPSLSDHYKKSSYETLSAMMNTLIGEQRVCDLTAEMCEYLLVSTYPQLSQNELWSRFEILSTALDQAVSLGYCSSNNLRAALRQAHIRDKLFGQVRNALAKKHFTKNELRKAYAYVLDRIKEGHYIYLGVLFRLVTGLESKIVCALRWSDLLYYPEYDLYSAIIARKINNSGEFEGFHDNEDYLLFPISKQLESVILHVKKNTGIRNENQLILGSLLPPGSSSNFITPSHLNQLTREMILAVGIDERIVSLPRHEDQMHETDLNKYSGDILRQNFRFWATEAAKLNTDELAYLLRNKPVTTLGCYYCDFLNEASQLMLHVKLNRIEAAICSPHSTPKKHPSFISSNHKVRIAGESGAKKCILLELSSEKDTDVKLSISSLYGVHYNMTSSGEEESIW